MTNSKYLKVGVVPAVEGFPVKVKMDFYTVARLFEMSPAVQHAVKKLLVLKSGRGHKDAITDLEEAIKSLNRELEDIKLMREFEEAENDSKRT